LNFIYVHALLLLLLVQAQVRLVLRQHQLQALGHSVPARALHLAPRALLVLNPQLQGLVVLAARLPVVAYLERHQQAQVSNAIISALRGNSLSSCADSARIG
jgi:hypothetical protein